MVIPPPLAWIPSFVSSTSRAIDQQMVYDLKPTVNPLVYSLKLSWTTALSGKLINGVWNLFEKWATHNDVTTNGKVDTDPRSMTIGVVIKRRFGNPKDSAPWEKKD
jgi:hypothetical protein